MSRLSDFFVSVAINCYLDDATTCVRACLLTCFAFRRVSFVCLQRDTASKGAVPDSVPSEGRLPLLRHADDGCDGRDDTATSTALAWGLRASLTLLCAYDASIVDP